ncbi:MAG TPA: methyltransferase domain-containing protein [Pyrinomonadaceae bacterium]|jgi:ubiquinone/menaquinone biosynthesis C-methylase UbiE|nr:methyltransferase domain-containing protein [Pyrinomonadaceae bacterium]
MPTAAEPTPPTTTRVRATYDRLASRYDAGMRPLERWGLARLRAATLRALPEGSRVLEVGAGTGANFPFYPRGSSGVASELSAEMLRVARMKERPAGVWLVRSRAEHLPFADAAFDAAFATLVFCSVTSPARAFSELRRVVRRGGTIALLEHVRPEGLLGYVFDALNLCTVALCDDHFNRRTALEAERAGLRVVSVERRLHGILQIIVCRV